MHQSMSCAGRNGVGDIRRWQQKENEMHVIVRPTRIDIGGSGGSAKQTWEPLLEDLKAVMGNALGNRNRKIEFPV